MTDAESTEAHAEAAALRLLADIAITQPQFGAALRAAGWWEPVVHLVAAGWCEGYARAFNDARARAEEWSP